MEMERDSWEEGFPSNHLFIHSFSKYTLYAYYVLGTVPSTGELPNKADNFPAYSQGKIRPENIYRVLTMPKALCLVFHP